MFFLSDYHVSEYRAFGSKDKKPRKRNLLKSAALIGAGVAGLGLAGYGLHKGFKMLNKVKKNPITKSSIPSTPNTKVTEKWSSSKLPQYTKDNVDYGDINDVRKKLDDPNHVWQFNNSNQLVTFGRGRDRKKRAKRMGRFGAKVRVGTAGLLGSTVGGLIGSAVSGYSKKGSLIGAGLGGTLGTVGSYLEHKASPYSPIGKKKWRDYKQPPKWYGIPTDKLDLIGER